MPPTSRDRLLAGNRFSISAQCSATNAQAAGRVVAVGQRLAAAGTGRPGCGRRPTGVRSSVRAQAPRGRGSGTATAAAAGGPAGSPPSRNALDQALVQGDVAQRGATPPAPATPGWGRRSAGGRGTGRAARPARRRAATSSPSSAAACSSRPRSVRVRSSSPGAASAPSSARAGPTSAATRPCSAPRASPSTQAVEHGRGPRRCAPTPTGRARRRTARPAPRTRGRVVDAGQHRRPGVVDQRVALERRERRRGRSSSASSRSGGVAHPVEAVGPDVGVDPGDGPRVAGRTSTRRCRPSSRTRSSTPARRRPPAGARRRAGPPSAAVPCAVASP